MCEKKKAAMGPAEDRAVRARLDAVASNPARVVLRTLQTSVAGLTPEQVRANRSLYGDNVLPKTKEKKRSEQILQSFLNPFTGILLFLAGISAVTDILLPALSGPGRGTEEVQPLSVLIILTMVLIAGILRLVQETKSGSILRRLLSMITTTCLVSRRGAVPAELPVEELVVGDIVHLAAGDVVPADVRVIEAEDMYVSQAPLTGESALVEKTALTADGPAAAVTEYENLALMGSHVVSGSALGVVVCTGARTMFGGMARSVSGESAENGFARGVNAVSWVLIRFMLVMVPLVFFITGFTKGDWSSSLLFAVSVAVGLTPEMLPVIVTACLAKGAAAMGRQKTIVKELDSIQSLGAVDVLCIDKTGTLTQDSVVLGYSMNLEGSSDDTVLKYAYLNSYFQTGDQSLIDAAVVRRAQEEGALAQELKELSECYEKTDEIPFDYERRRVTTTVRNAQGEEHIITKGAVEEVLKICTLADYGGEVRALDADTMERVLEVTGALNAKGFRVLAVAHKDGQTQEGAPAAPAEEEMILTGYLAFLDPPKASAREAIGSLGRHGVTAKILTGDNAKVTQTVCEEVGIPAQDMLLGPEIDAMDDEQLAREAETTGIFARLTPAQKARIVSVLKNSGHTVGFIGDGINDAAAMQAADVSISVDTAVDAAKDAADIILLEKDLMVLEQGIVEGRKTYANMIKYIKITASSNFGNVFSVLAAAALLPFLPMTSVQLIVLNLMYDLSCIAFPWDHVDEEYLKVPRRWDARGVGSFMLWLGPVSSVFDWITYGFLYFVLCPLTVSHGLLFHQLDSVYSGSQLAALQAGCAVLFQTGWFVESMWSQTLVIHMLRTVKNPFSQSCASLPLTLLTLAGAAAATLLPFTGAGAALGLVPLPPVYFAFLLPCVLLYMLLSTAVKRLYIRRNGELL